MDPGTLMPLARQPDLRYVVPAASRAEAMKRSGVREERLVCVDAGDEIELLPGLIVKPVRSAHETLQLDSAGHHLFSDMVSSSAERPYSIQATRFRSRAKKMKLRP
jgi:L-ascorbate metabolism protein UlaG (beta-lactamase superfamily)